MTDVPTERVMEILALVDADIQNHLADFDDAPHAAPLGEYNPYELWSLLTDLLALRAAAAEVIARNRDYLTHLNNGAQTDPLTRAIEALARALQSHSTGDE